MKTRRAGFTLVEVLTAMAFLAILVPVLLSAMSTASRGAAISERRTIALQLGENQLNDLIVENTWSSGSNQGDFGDDYPGYRWELQNVSWTEQSAMTELTMIVYYQVRGEEHSVQMSTLISPDAQTTTTQ